MSLCQPNREGPDHKKDLGPALSYAPASWKVMQTVPEVISATFWAVAVGIVSAPRAPGLVAPTVPPTSGILRAGSRIGEESGLETVELIAGQQAALQNRRLLGQLVNQRRGSF